MSNVKSIVAVNTGNSWAVCRIKTDGSQLYVLPGIFVPRYTQEHTNGHDNLMRHIEMGCQSYAKPLPPNVTVME